MGKLSVLASLVLAPVAAASITYGVATTKVLDKTKLENEDLKQTNITISAENEDLKTNVETLTAEKSTLQENLTTTQTALNLANTRVTQIEGELVENQAELNQVKTELDEARAKALKPTNMKSFLFDGEYAFHIGTETDVVIPKSYSEGERKYFYITVETIDEFNYLKMCYGLGSPNGMNLDTDVMLSDGTIVHVTSIDELRGYENKAPFVVKHWSFRTEGEDVAITAIQSNSFKFSEGLRSIYIPKNITKIGASAFLGCTTLTNVMYEGTEEEWNSIEILEGNECLTSATITYSVKNAEDVENAQIASLTARATQLETNIETLTQEKVDLNTQITALNSTVSELNVEIDNLNARIVELEGQSNEYAEKLCGTYFIRYDHITGGYTQRMYIRVNADKTVDLKIIDGGAMGELVVESHFGAITFDNFYSKIDLGPVCDWTSRFQESTYIYLNPVINNNDLNYELILSDETVDLTLVKTTESFDDLITNV